MPTTSTVSSRSALAALSPAAGDSAILTEAGREGLFRWSTANHSSGLRDITNHSNASVSPLAEGWFGIEKTGGTNGVYDAGAVSTQGIAGALVVRVRRWRQLSIHNVNVGANTHPTADASYGMTLRLGFAGSSYFIGTGTGGSLSSGSHDWSRSDVLLYRNAVNAVKVYSCPRSVVVEPNRVEEQLANYCTLLYTYASTYAGTLYLDSSILNIGNGAQAQFIDIGSAGDGLVDADTQQGMSVAPASDPTGAGGAWLRLTEGAVKVGWFGAKGDGSTNDTAALASAAAYIRRRGGGTVELEPRTYVVGAQTLGNSEFWAHEPAKLLYFAYCRRKVTVRGNGCTLLCAPNLKYGQFDPGSGASSTGAAANPIYRSTPFEGAIFGEFNEGDIEIDGVTVDGNLAGITVGGSWGDSGIQIPFDAFRLYDNKGRIIVRNCSAHRLGLDGLNIRCNFSGKGSKAQPTLIEDFKANECGRQGASFVGARLLTVINGQFLRTGKNGYISSSPCAGVDVEPDHPGYADEILFLNCISSFNAGANLGIASGRNSRILWKGGRFVGTDTYALWLGKPSIRVEDALIVGSVMCDWQDNLARGVLEEGYAPTFVRCMFSDNIEYSEGASLHSDHIQVLKGRVWFQRCSFDYRRNFRLPTLGALNELAVFEDCDIHCDSGDSQTVSDRAIWLGVNKFSGIGLSFMPYFNLKDVGGTVRWGVGGSKTHDWPSIASGSSATTTVAVPRARVGDNYVYEAHMLDDDQNFAGLTFAAAATADDVVTVTASNASGAAVDPASGTLIVEVQGGRRYFEGSKTHDWPSIGAGASASTTLDVPGARVGDKRVYAATMSNGWGGLAAFCEPTANDTVTVTALNLSGGVIDRPSGVLSVTGVR